ncbi:hypothetical protein [Methylobacillus flagellatus]|uniref:hypothetical protein n=1 Tax=Methylobacillus flagellatus TaxID=405 RepID=UPI0038620DC0
MPQDSLCKQGVIQLLYQEHQAWVACLDQQIVQILAQEKQLAMRYLIYIPPTSWHRNGHGVCKSITCLISNAPAPGVLDSMFSLPIRGAIGASGFNYNSEDWQGEHQGRAWVSLTYEFDPSK